MSRRSLFIGVGLAIGFGLVAGPAFAIKLNIPIGSLTEVNSLGQYIQAFYRYFVGAIGIIAMAMIMYGGYRWIVAAGSADQIQEAKSTIVAAIVGLFLALISFVFLNFLNPELTALRDPNVSLQARVLGLGFFCGQVPNAPNGPCGELKTVPNSQGKVCYGDLCSVPGEVCVRIPTQEKPTCLNLDEACKQQSNSNCQQFDQQLIAAGVADKACRKNDMQGVLKDIFGFAGPVTDVCWLGATLTCPTGFDRVNCNAANGVDTFCYKDNQPRTCKTSAGGLSGLIVNIYGRCADPSNTRAAEYSDSICCAASDTDPALSKQFVRCQELPNTLGGDQTEIAIDCAAFDAVIGPYRDSTATVCDPPKKCWAKMRLVYRNNANIDQADCDRID